MWQMMTNRVMTMMLVMMLASGWCCGLMGQAGKMVYAGTEEKAGVAKQEMGKNAGGYAREYVGGNVGGHECCGHEGKGKNGAGQKTGEAAKGNGSNEKGKEDSGKCPCEHAGGYTHTQAMETVYASGVMTLEKVADCLLTGMMMGEGCAGEMEAGMGHGGGCDGNSGSEERVRCWSAPVYQHCLLLI